MYELFSSNAQDESLYLLREEITSLEEAMKALELCNMPHCQIEKFDVPESLKDKEKEAKKKSLWEYIRFMGIYGRYTLIATKHYGEITKFY